MKLTKANITKLMNSDTHAIINYDRKQKNVEIVKSLYAAGGVVPNVYDETGRQTSPEKFNASHVDALIAEGFLTITKK